MAMKRILERPVGVFVCVCLIVSIAALPAREALGGWFSRCAGTTNCSACLAGGGGYVKKTLNTYPTCKGSLCPLKTCDNDNPQPCVQATNAYVYTDNQCQNVKMSGGMPVLFSGTINVMGCSASGDDSA